MNRLTRITAILIQLQSKRIVAAKEIAERFEVSLRTVYRDIRTLQEAGVPIGSENGVGYFIIDGYRLPPVSLTEEEANTLIILEEFVRSQGDTSLSTNFDSFLTKIKATLKNFQKDNVELLASRTFSFYKGEKIESRWLSEIQKSISDKITLSITYRSLSKEEVTERSIEPLAVYFTNNVWIAIAYCRLRQGIREFRLDRISRLNKTSEPFEWPAQFDIQHYFESFQR